MGHEEQLRLLREFAGWLSGSLPELRDVEIPKLGEQCELFLEARNRQIAEAKYNEQFRVA